MDELKRKKLLLLSPDFGYGGAERSIAHLSVLLSPYYDILFVVFNLDIPQAYRVGGVIHSLNVSSSKTLLGKARGFLKRLRQLRQLKKREAPEVCISFLEGSDYLNVLSRQSESVIVSVRGSKYYDPNIKGWLGYLRHHVFVPWVYRNADVVIPVDLGIENELRKFYNLPPSVFSKVIPNFYDGAEITEKSLAAISENWSSFFMRYHVVVASGRLSAEKGFQYLIKAFALLTTKNRNARLVVIGSGPLKQELLALCSTLGLTASLDEPDPGHQCEIVFTGFLSNPFPLVAKSKLFVLSSLTEGFPNALVEAMCLARPVLAANCPYGPASILGPKIKDDYLHEYGMLLPLLSDQSNVLSTWADQINQFLQDDDLQQYYSTRSIERSAQYTAQRALNDWKSVIEK
jgi:glycosyltransferase involved in cell wall biosynthesis